jgi:Mn-dependent DtxR family transcriptional regulator
LPVIDSTNSTSSSIDSISIISTFSDDKIISLFKAVALSEVDINSATIIAKLRFTRKQYYSRVEKLIHVGLIKRVGGGNYRLTCFGKLIFRYVLKIETAVKYYWKLKAIDSILLSKNVEFTAEEYQRIIDNIIDNDEIKGSLLQIISRPDSQYHAKAVIQRHSIDL